MFMPNVVDIVHFKDNKLSSKLRVDTFNPEISSKGFVKSGGVFVTLETTGKSMKLSLQELTLAIAKLQSAASILIADEYDLKVEAAERYAAQT
jgi:hypothetical protein